MVLVGLVLGFASACSSNAAEVSGAGGVGGGAIDVSLRGRDNNAGGTTDSGLVKAALPCPTDGPCRIMPLGDSITDGYNVPGGYRIKLWAELQAAGADIDFVGSLQNGPDELSDKDHEGHSGWRIDELDAIMSDTLTTYSPDIILVHIGTNDILNDADLETVEARFVSLLDTIAATSPNAALVVAGLVPIDGEVEDEMIVEFNDLASDLVEERASEGMNISFVDMHATVTLEDLADGIHPNEVGYDKMAEAWLSGLSTLRP
ncbi:MAG: SGNH/GDSL hydrolase family protein [Polyangiaceae bacterium]